jgi:hypothetical protein
LHRITRGLSTLGAHRDMERDGTGHEFPGLHGSETGCS